LSYQVDAVRVQMESVFTAPLEGVLPLIRGPEGKSKTE